MLFPEDLKYAKTDELLRLLEDGSALIGITDYAQSEMGDLVFINLPEVGDEAEKDAAICDIESVKSVADILSPVSGEIVEINEELLDAPEKINEDPYGAWFVKIANAAGYEDLMSAEEYRAYRAIED